MKSGGEMSNLSGGHTDSAQIVRCGCKINLFLQIIGRRADGYHDLSTLFFPLCEPHDELLIRPQDPKKAAGLRVIPAAGTLAENTPDFCPGLDFEHNTLTKAYDLYAWATGFKPALSLELRKGIPVGGGLGGGSSDAAVLLNWLQEHCPNPLAHDGLISLAARVGADVPFFIINRPCLAEGIGERLTPVDLPLAGCWLILLCSATRVDTAWAFRQWDQQLNNSGGLTDSGGEHGGLTVYAKPDKNYSSDLNLLWVNNCFEPLVFKHYPSLNWQKKLLIQLGAGAAGMSGSGSAIFGLFRGLEMAEMALAELEQGQKNGLLPEKTLVFGPLRLN